MENSRIVVGITGASGSILGWRLLERLRSVAGIETHLILSRAAERTAWLEIGKKASEFRELANQTYSVEAVGACLASGSYQTTGMVVSPCSINTMSSIARGITDNLITRAADVTLKERRRLVLLVREMPFHLGHLRTMVELAEMGAIVAPPVPGFYGNPQTALDLVDHCVERTMDLLGVPAPDARRWDGGKKEKA